MKNEVVFNLWYVLDDKGIVYFLLGRSYPGIGSDEENLAMLLSHAATDHRVAQYFPLPDRIKTTIVTDRSRREIPVIHYSSLASLGGPEILFREVVLLLQAQVHAMSGLALNDDPVVCISPLFLDVDGTLVFRESSLKASRSIPAPGV